MINFCDFDINKFTIDNFINNNIESKFSTIKCNYDNNHSFLLSSDFISCSWYPILRENDNSFRICKTDKLKCMFDKFKVIDDFMFGYQKNINNYKYIPFVRNSGDYFNNEQIKFKFAKNFDGSFKTKIILGKIKNNNFEGTEQKINSMSEFKKYIKYGSKIRVIFAMNKILLLNREPNQIKDFMLHLECVRIDIIISQK